MRLYAIACWQCLSATLHMSSRTLTISIQKPSRRLKNCYKPGVFKITRWRRAKGDGGGCGSWLPNDSRAWLYLCLLWLPLDRRAEKVGPQPHHAPEVDEKPTGSPTRFRNISPTNSIRFIMSFIFADCASS
jgi:hypothetical protein